MQKVRISGYVLNCWLLAVLCLGWATGFIVAMSIWHSTVQEQQLTIDVQTTALGQQQRSYARSMRAFDLLSPRLRRAVDCGR